jgi:hypothetical protein
MRWAVRVADLERKEAALGPGADRVCPTPVAERKVVNHTVVGRWNDARIRSGRGSGGAGVPEGRLLLWLGRRIRCRALVDAGGAGEFLGG